MFYAMRSHAPSARQRGISVRVATGAANVWPGDRLLAPSSARTTGSGGSRPRLSSSAIGSGQVSASLPWLVGKSASTRRDSAYLKITSCYRLHDGAERDPRLRPESGGHRVHSPVGSLQPPSVCSVWSCQEKARAARYTTARRAAVCQTDDEIQRLCRANYCTGSKAARSRSRPKCFLDCRCLCTPINAWAQTRQKPL